MTCDDIQGVLTDYLTRELGPARSDLVRRHLERCERCRAAAREIAETLDLLREAGRGGAAAPEHLSERHRRRITRAYTHPIIHFVDSHHVLISLLAAAAVAALLVWHLLRVRIVSPAEAGGGVEVRIGRRPPPPGPDPQGPSGERAPGRTNELR